MNRTPGLITLTLMGAWVFAGCGGDAAETDMEPEAVVETGAAEETASPHGAMSTASTALTYECEEGGSFTLVLLDGASRARIELDDQSHDLEPAPTEEGMGYVGGDIEFVGSGTSATVRIGGETVYSGCEATGHGAN